MTPKELNEQALEETILKIEEWKRAHPGESVQRDPNEVLRRMVARAEKLNGTPP